MKTTTDSSIQRRLLHIVLFSFSAITAVAQTSSEKLSKALIISGFENVRVATTNSGTFVSLEDNLYRWNVDGIRSALDIIATMEKKYPATLILLKKGIPQIQINLSTPKWQNNLNGANPTTAKEVDIEVTYKINDSWKLKKKITPSNPTENKIDLVVYPQFGLQNTLLTQIYEIQLNIAPAIEVSLWPGMLFTGQVIFPIVNQLGYEGDFIRPGFVTLSQEFRLPLQWFGRATIGNFNANRYGADVCFNHPLNNNRWNISLNAGLTGSSHFYDGQWVTNEINTLTWFAKTGYYYPKFNLQFDLSYGRYLNNDYGFRIDCTRHFGETTIGVYVMYTGSKSNGGFHFSVPLPTHKRGRKHSLRLVSSRYFDWEYNAGTEFYYGRYYETRPNENRSEHWINPIFIKSEILKND